MNIWGVKHQIDVDFALVAYKRFEDIDPHVFFKGERLAPGWKVPSAHLNPAQPGARAVDFPFFEYGALLCSTVAWGILKPHLEAEVEVLPVDVEGYSYQLLNPIQVIDCLDMQQSQMRYNKNGRVTDIDQYVFHQEKLKGVYLFKLPELTRTHIYATEAFRGIIESHQLTGLEFKALP